jgi:hypothetical protein
MRGTASLNEVMVGYSTDSREQQTGNYIPPKPVYVINGNIGSEETFRQLDPNSIKSITRLKPADAKAYMDHRQKPALRWLN